MKLLGLVSIAVFISLSGMEGAPAPLQVSQIKGQKRKSRSGTATPIEEGKKIPAGECYAAAIVRFLTTDPHAAIAPALIEAHLRKYPTAFEVGITTGHCWYAALQVWAQYENHDVEKITNSPEYIKFKQIVALSNTLQQKIVKEVQLQELKEFVETKKLD